jgi:hypothetical protein
MDNVGSAARDQLQRLAFCLRRYIDPELLQRVAERSHFISTPDVPATLVVSKAFGQELGDFASEFLCRGIDGADVITTLKRHYAP